MLIAFIGYEGDGESCFNVDECDINKRKLDNEHLHHCNSSAICQDTEGSYICTCATGHFGDGYLCYDTDECMTEEHFCHPVLGL